jgi:LPXTG-site transpeptidase (sortase) family protein
MTAALIGLFILAGNFTHQTATVSAQDAPRLLIPSIEVNAPLHPVYVRQMPDGNSTWDVSGLHQSVGVFDGLTPIGQPGNAVIGGHSEQARGEADVFYNLHEVRVGDEVQVVAGENTLTYRVVSVREVNLYDLSILIDTEDERLTLITCDRDSFTGSGYGQRVVVVAQRVG